MCQQAAHKLNWIKRLNRTVLWMQCYECFQSPAVLCLQRDQLTLASDWFPPSYIIKHHLKSHDVTWQSHDVTWQSQDVTWQLRQSHDNHMTVTCSPCPSQSVWSSLKVTQNVVIKALQIPLEHETKHISNYSLPKSNGRTSMTKLCNEHEPLYLPQVVISGPCPLLISVRPPRMVHTYLDPEKLDHLVLQCRLALGP